MPGGGKRRERIRTIIMRELATGKKREQELARALGYGLNPQAIRSLRMSLGELSEYVDCFTADKAKWVAMKAGRRVCEACGGKGVVS
jgi:hypothetical protein